MSIANKLAYLNATKTAIRTAISEKGVSISDDDTFRSYADKIVSISASSSSGGSFYTGHVDTEGLQFIGWDSDDIAWLQNHVFWFEELDDLYKVNDESKQMWLDYQNGDYIVPTTYSNSTSINTTYSNINYCPKLDTSNVASMSYMFYGCDSLQTIPTFDTSNVASMNYMFSSCDGLQTIPTFDTSNVTDMSYMFYGCKSLQAIPTLDTSNVTDMYRMFSSCSNLQTIPALDTSNVTNMSYMFYACGKLQTIPTLDTSNVTDMYRMFYGCNNLQTIPTFDTSNVTNMSDMFYNCSNLQICNPQNAKASFDLHYSDSLTYDSIMFIINNAQTVEDKAMTFGSTNLAKLTETEIQIATDKGWTVA